MKRADIKVGETYGVRLKPSARSTVVPATVVSIDKPVSWKAWSHWGDRHETITKQTGGILVKFDQPTRVAGYSGFSLASDTNAHAGDIAETYAFHDQRNGKGQVGKLFVGLWDDIQAEEREAEEAQQRYYAEAKAKADEFEPTLDAYLARLEALGINVETHTDFSGIHGDIDRTLSTAQTNDRYSSRRATGFAWGDVRVDRDLFEWLLQQAEATGAKWDRSETGDDE